MRRAFAGQFTQPFYGNRAASLGKESQRVYARFVVEIVSRRSWRCMAEIIQVDSLHPQADRIARAAAVLRAGELVGLPTDTVYGVASDAYNGAAAEKVFAAKQRTATAPLLILVDSLEMAQACMAGSSELFAQLTARFWPGPLTIVVPASERIPAQVTAGTATVGIRFPRAPIALALIAASGGPITASSANLSGQPECRSAEDVNRSIGTGLPLILDGGPSGDGAASTVVSVLEGRVKMLRKGAISEKAISDFLRI
jgi:L-threonylcarbamoyladenylate synthase